MYKSSLQLAENSCLPTDRYSITGSLCGRVAQGEVFIYLRIEIIKTYNNNGWKLK